MVDELEGVQAAISDPDPAETQQAVLEGKRVEGGSSVAQTRTPNPEQLTPLATATDRNEPPDPLIGVTVTKTVRPEERGIAGQIVKDNNLKEVVKGSGTTVMTNTAASINQGK